MDHGDTYSLGAALELNKGVDTNKKALSKITRLWQLAPTPTLATVPGNCL